jgi:hypothetical protein
MIAPTCERRIKLLNILISIPSFIVSMNINQYSGLGIMVMIAVLIFTVTAISVIDGAFAQKTDGNKTGGDMTGKPGMSQEDVEALCSLSPACIT